MKHINVILLILLTATFALGQNKLETAKRVEQTDKELAPVKAYAESIKAYVDKKEFPDMVVADVADFNKSDKPEWKVFDSHKAYQESDVNSYETYFIWKKDGKIAQVNVTYSSPSGDWAHYVFHTYYPNGKAAKIEKELRTFMGDLIVNRTSYHSKAGKQLAKTESYKDLNTGKAIKKPESFMDMEVDVYEKVAKLPFVDKDASASKK